MRIFFRDCRGDTIHPSTLELMVKLGLLEEFLRLPHRGRNKVSINVTIDAVFAAMAPRREKFS
jgi:hypothetical protein